MAHYICPCCGQRFNGKKCRNCYYESFGDEIERSLHTHQEVNVPDVPASKPGHVSREDWERQKREFKRNQETRRNQKRKAPKWLIWVLVLSLVDPVLTIVGELLDGISTGISAVTREPEAPEPDAVIPEGALQILSQDGFTLYIGESEDNERYPLFLENATDQDVHLSARSIVVDGFLSEMSSAWCDSPAGTLREGDLYLDREEISQAVLGSPGEIALSYVIYETEDYEDLLEASAIIEGGGVPVPVIPEGKLLMDNEAVQISYLGYVPDAYDPEAFCEGHLLFYVENRTDRELSVYGEEVLLDEQEGLNFWCSLPANTRTITRMYLYSASEMESPGLESILQMQITAAGEAELFDSTDLGTVRFALS